MNRLYADINLHRAIASELIARGVDTLTGQEDGADGLSDPDVLRRATELGRILVTHDKDFLAIVAGWQTSGIHFTGVVWVKSLASLSECIESIALLVLAVEPENFANQIYYAPL